MVDVRERWLNSAMVWGKRSDLWHGGGDGLGWNKAGMCSLSKLGWWFGWLGARRGGEIGRDMGLKKSGMGEEIGRKGEEIGRESESR
ncbi:unnamed protein product [Prunus armeniaca]